MFLNNTVLDVKGPLSQNQSSYIQDVLGGFEFSWREGLLPILSGGPEIRAIFDIGWKCASIGVSLHHLPKTTFFSHHAQKPAQKPSVVPHHPHNKVFSLVSKDYLIWYQFTCWLNLTIIFYMQHYFERYAENTDIKVTRSLTSRSFYPLTHHLNSLLEVRYFL